MSNFLFITARFASSRLPGKCLLPLGNLSVLGHSITRAINANFLPILCTSDQTTDDALVKEAQKYEIPYFRGSHLNKIKRWSACANEIGAEQFHVIDGDDPFFDCDEIRISIKTQKDEKLDLIMTSNRSDSGFASVGFTSTADFMHVLADRTNKLPTQDLDVIPWETLLLPSDKVSKMPDSFLISDQGLKIRLTLDYPEDLQLLNIVAQKCGVNASRTSIEDYLNTNRELLELNNFRNIEFLSNKVRQLATNFNIKGGK